MVDVLVIGSGIAGMSAALRAQQLGAEVQILEKAWVPGGLGNSRQSGAGYGTAGEPHSAAPEELYASIMELTDGHARPDVAKSWSENVHRAYQWQIDQGAVYSSSDEGANGMIGSPGSNRLEPFQAQVPGRPWFGAGPDRFLGQLTRSFKAAGGVFWTGARARKLIVEEGRVCGVVVATSDGLQEVRAKAVVMADGGFQGDSELMAKYITTDYLIDGSPLDTGDCLRMSMAVGAKIVNMEWFYGHCRHGDAVTNSRLTPHPAPGAVIEAGIVVDGTGRRFIDESVGTSRVSVGIAHSATPADCWVIMDDTIWNGPAKERPAGGGAVLPVNPTVTDEGGTLLDSTSIDGLAAAIPAAMGGLQQTVEQYNAALKDGQGATLAVPRTGGAAPLVTPPFWAMPLVAGVYFTMGGPLVNGRAQVLNEDEQVIEGLYAAGGTMGGLMGGPKAGYAGGWAEASTFGLIAAESATADLATTN